MRHAHPSIRTWARTTATMRRFSLVLLVLLTLLLSGCGADDTASNDESSGGDTSYSIDNLRDDLASEYGDAGWYGAVTDLQVEQRMFADVLIVGTNLPASDAGIYETALAIGDALAALDSYRVAPNIEILDGKGAHLASYGNGTAATEHFELPASPTTAEQIGPWIDEVFGDSGDAWYASIQTVELSTSLPGWSSPIIVVHTDLPGGDAREISQQQTRYIGYAIDLSGQTVAPNFAVMDADGEQLIAGGIPVMPYVY